LVAILLSTLTAMLNPLPAIVSLPLALLWFGLGNASLIFVLTFRHVAHRSGIPGSRI
jgi:ABC-type nitrate/sulfonate/bicarbonate transport system permease component